MKFVDEKRLLATMLRNSGTPDLQLEAELRELGFNNYGGLKDQTVAIKKEEEVSQPLVP
jgi:hypothetical protein